MQKSTQTCMNTQKTNMHSQKKSSLNITVPITSASQLTDVTQHSHTCVLPYYNYYMLASYGL